MSDLKVNPATVEFLKKEKAKNKKRRVLTTVIGVLLVAGITAAGYAGYQKYKTNKQLETAKAAVAELKPGNRDGWEKVRTLVDKGEITRDQARDAMQANFEKEEQARMDAYFKTPAKDRDKYLDGLIDEMQKRMADWEKNRPTSRPTSRPDRQDRGPTSRPNDDAERAARQQARTDNQSPMQRAQRSEFRAAMQARMAARGIQMPGRGGPGGGGRGPGGWGGGGGGGGRGGR